ncbi:hypothetical protein Goarm_020422, partial [Gossypium armourianum]|nr:hypothetical protein [Gossypium armourianum]
MASTSTSLIPLRGHGRKASFSSSPAKTALKKALGFSFSSRSSVVICVKSSSGAVKYNEVVVDEEMDKIRRLQNGSDVRGVALEGEKGRTVDLTPPAVEAIAESFGEWIIKALQKERGRPVEDVTVSLGKDPRISGASLSVAVFAGLARAGCLTFDMGLATTPACFMSTLLPPFAYDASIMMTASHLPYTRNGLKFFTKKGGLTSPEVEEICDKAAHKYANRLTKVSTMLNSPPKKVDFMRAYAKHLRDIIKERVNHPIHYDTPLKGFQ